MNKFLIDRVPEGAVYCGRDDFLHAFPLGDDKFDIDRLLNGVQVIDTRLTYKDLATIDKIQDERPELASLFAIEDKIESRQRGEVLNSFSLFKMRGERSTTNKTFSAYVDGLKRWIALFENIDQNMRIYVGSTAWEVLHNEGMLKARHVDFYRMRDSSEYTEIGAFWRFLAFDDYDYEYVCIRESDGDGKLIDGDWEIADDSIAVQKLNALEHLNRGAHFSSEILPTIAPETRTGAIPESFPLFFWADDNRLSVPLFMYRLSEYVQTTSPQLIRGPKRLPFLSIVSIFCSHFARGDERIIYHPESNLWTNIRERHPNLNFRYIDEHWIFHLTRIINVCFHMRQGYLPSVLYREFERCGNDWFFKRLFDQLIDEGNFFVEKDYGDEYVFDLDSSGWQKLIRGSVMNDLRFFFIDKIDLRAEYVDSNVFFMQNEERIDDFANEIQVVDTRWSAEDLERIKSAERSDLSYFYEIEDMIESPKRGEALCSICIFFIGDTPWMNQPFHEYLEGLHYRIDIFRNELSSQKLRVYVGNSAWEILHKEGILKADDVDFVRMRRNSSGTRLGTTWRHLAFDDYDYPYVYIDDTDRRAHLLPDGGSILVDELRKDQGILDRCFSRGDGGKRPHLTSALSFARDGNANLFHHVDIDESLFAFTPSSRIRNPASYYETAVCELVRGPDRLPFDDIVPILVESMMAPDGYTIFHQPSFQWTFMKEVSAPLQCFASDETWPFYMSKLIDIKVWVRPEDMKWVESAIKRYGDHCFWRRLHQGIQLDGNYLACGDQGVDSFSFDRFLE